MTETKFLRREASSRYLRAKWGLSFTAGTLAKLCSQKRGPETHRAGRLALHAPEALDAWAAARIKAPAAKGHDAGVPSSTSPLPPIAPAAGEWRRAP